MTEEKTTLSPQSCPCRFCEDRHAGCHTIQCPHGWFEWNEYMKDRREKLGKARQERAAWQLYRYNVIKRMKSRGGMQRYYSRKRRETP